MSDLSIVIRCWNDPQVFRCIASVDCRSEIVVSFTGGSGLADRIRDAGAVCVLAPRGNLSQVSNTGFDATHGDRVIITDSDTQFEPGCIARLTSALESDKIARARLRFMTEGAGIGSRVVASARDFTYSLPVVFTPGVAIRREVLSELEGRLFNDTVPYAVDAELDFRIKRWKIPTVYVHDAWIRHVPISIRHDLYAAHRIGRGCKTSIDHWNRDGRFGHLQDDALKAVRPEHFPRILREKGLVTLAYQTIWDRAYWLGFRSQKWWSSQSRSDVNVDPDVE